MIEEFNHPFNDKKCSHRLLWEYFHYDHIIVGIDFDNTIKPVHPSSKNCDQIIDLLKQCSDDPKIILCLWTICPDGEEQEKLEYCKSLGIKIDYINESPFAIGNWKGKKQYFNVLLDDRAGLESAYNNLKYVIDHADIKSNKSE